MSLGADHIKRATDIDAVRGFMLAWMTLTHLPTALTPWINQPFGYVSASEGFIVLSALFTGLIYYRLLARRGPEKMTSRLLVRTLRLYGWHVLLLLFVFLVVARYAVGAQAPGLRNLLDFYFAAGAAHAFADALLLVYRPPLLDIIPLYIIFLFLSPWIILAARRIPWKYILSGSFALWLLAQFGLREISYAFLARHFGLGIPLNEMGAFNLWAWQLVWVVGMWCGVRWAESDLPLQKWSARTWKPALLLAASFLSIRYAQLAGLDLGPCAPLFDKWALGPAHLLNSAALAVLVIHFRSALKPLAIRPLVLLGQSSLQVFCTHFVFCFVGLAMMGNGDRIFGWRQVALIVGTFAALLSVAKLRARPELSGPAPAASGSPRPVPARVTAREDRFTHAA